MNKHEILAILKEKSRELTELQSNIAKSPSMKTKGILIIKHQKGTLRLFRKTGKATEKYLSSKDRNEIIRLATKTYAIKLDKAAELEKKQIDRCIELLESKKNSAGKDMADTDLVHGNMPDYIRENSIPSEVTDDGFAEHWQKEKYNSRWKKNTDTFYETPRGEKVRSKSEWMIASMLDKAGIPYRYEEIVPLDGDVGVFMHPDFTVLNKRTRKVYYWEHFGAMSNNDYIEGNFMPKIQEYYNFGFLPGDKLLMTFESSGHPLDTTEVKRIIENYLL
jgi:hypothetical protein